MVKVAARSLLPSDHFKGSSKASVMLLEYADFECHRCVALFHTLEDAMHWLDNSVCFVFRHFPDIEGHSHAFSAAQAAEAAAAQGKFWEMHHSLFSHSPNLEDPQLIGYAEQLGMSRDLFKRELLVPTHAKKVNDDCAAAVADGVDETPAFFINGIRYKGPWDLDTLLDAIEDAGVSV
ncbi:MAG TPA: thioredoxin domain-containing protein [Pyrinomonadaceae bacterium]|nr:thioredoxin domain-containing protein [Pyrinomonadaceae bacterium]